MATKKTYYIATTNNYYWQHATLTTVDNPDTMNPIMVTALCGVEAVLQVDYTWETKFSKGIPPHTRIAQTKKESDASRIYGVQVDCGDCRRRMR